ncbi:MAG TPA: ABC transporter permease, partial [Acidobacteriota bacterium]|nr:ABC transporter permease [Acidobacteriota bacterium]
MNLRTLYEIAIADLRHSFRLLLKKRALTFVAVLTLALGIGANTAIFGLIESVLLKPLPYHEPDSLVLFQKISSSRGTGLNVSPLDFQDLTSQSDVFASTSAFTTETAVLTGKGEPERLTVSYTTSKFFDVLKIRPLLGRLFTSHEAKPGAGQSVVLGYNLWKRRFGSDPNVAGTSIVLNGRNATILGVAPRSFDFPEKTEMWKPLIFPPEELDPSQRGARWISVISRLKGDSSLEQAQTIFQTLSTQFQKLYPRTHEGLRFSLISLHEHLVKDVRAALIVLLVAVVLVLLIACANVANLLLAHASTREGEIAIRLSMGAGRARLLQQFLTESLLLSFLSAIVGLIFHVWISELLWKLGPVDLSAFQVHTLHFKIFAFNFGVAFVIGVLVGLLPALQASSLQIAPKLSMGGKGAIGGRKPWAKILVSCEVALTLVLLTAAGLLIRSFLLLY